MKLRYLLLPVIIVCFMILIVNYDKDVVNKELVFDNVNIYYPYFDNAIIDSFISDYINLYSDKDNVFIDYDYYDDSDKYYVTFYKYFFDGNMINSDKDYFVIDTYNDSIDKIDNINYEFDFVYGKYIDRSSKMIALTFDDGPSYNTNRVLDILEKYNIHATFFVLGSKIKGNEYILKRMVNSDNEIGNHTYSHFLLTRYKEDTIKKEIEDTNNLIFDVINSYPKLLRPSYGSYNSKVKKAASMPVIIWNVDTLDWKYHSSKKIASRVINKVKDGDIVLMHDVYSSTSNALDILIPILSDRGYSFVTVSELFYYKGISLEGGKVYGYAR